MSTTASTRFSARPVAQLLDELADAFDWPRSRPVRLLAGDRAHGAARLVVHADEHTLADHAGDGAGTVAVLATPPSSTTTGAGRRTYDPFVAAAPGEPGGWRERDAIVLDASLLLAGGRGGVDERIAARIGVEPLPGLTTLVPARSLTRDVAKLVGYVPADALEQVRDAMFAVGAGTIGGYDRCSWSTSGTGTFRGGEGTDPAVGTRGEFERVAEERIEVVVPRHLVEHTCRAFVAAHPYEEPAFDVVPLAIPSAVGFGRVGVLGPGGGGAVWTALGALDSELEAYGRVDAVPAGATCVVHVGPVRDLLGALLDETDLGLVVASAASEAELELLASRGVAVLLARRAACVGAVIDEVAGALSRRLTLPVTADAGLRFPEHAVEIAAVNSATTTTAANLFDGPIGGTAAAAAAAAPPSAAAPLDFATGTWRLHFDGGSRGNPGPAAYGWVLYAPSGEEVLSSGVRVGRATNNVAEWTGLLRGLERAAELGVRTLAVRGDSELVIKQLTGVYKVKNETLKPLAEEAKAVMRRFAGVDVRHVYRTENARADEVANEAMDGLRNE